MAQIFKNNLAGVLATGLTPSSTSMTLLDASNFPAPAGGDFYLLTLIGLNANGQEASWEIVKVTAKASNTLTMERAQEGTTATSWPAATTVQLRLTAGSVVAREPAISAGTTAQYWSGGKSWRDFFTDVRAATLAGLSTATNAAISATDTVLSALGKLQKQVSDNLATLTSHTGNTSNPHGVTKSQVGLGSVDNTSDANKPISTATQTALDATVKRLDVGTSPAQVPATQHLGKLAYMDELAALRATLTQPQAIGAVWFERVSNTSIKLFMRGSDGVARSTTLTLS